MKQKIIKKLKPFMYIYGDSPNVIVDIGTETTKIGYSTQTQPSYYDNTCNTKNDFISPLKYSKIENVETYINHLHSCLLTFDMNIKDNTVSICLRGETLENKKIIMESMFGLGYFNSLIFLESNVLDLFSYGKVSGLVVNLSSLIEVAAINDGLLLEKMSIDFGSEDLTNDFFKILQEYNEHLNFYSQNSKKDNFKTILEIKYIKEGVLIFSNDFSTEQIYNHKNKKEIIISSSCKNLLESYMQKIIKLIVSVIEKCNSDQKNTLLNNIILSGDCSKIIGLYDRLLSELIKIYPPSKVRVANENLFHTFFGASIVCSLGSMRQLYISKAEFDECGSHVLERNKYSWIAN